MPPYGVWRPSVRPAPPPPSPPIYNGSRPDAAGGRSGTIHPHRGGREGDPGPARPLPPQGRVFADGGSRRRDRVGEGENGGAGTDPSRHPAPGDGRAGPAPEDPDRTRDLPDPRGAVGGRGGRDGPDHRAGT